MIDLESLWFGPPPDAAPTLVFLHEGLGSASAWRDFPRRLAEKTGCGALVYSRRGYGSSPPATLPRPISYMHDEAAILGDVLEHYRVREAILIGHSDGASIALIYAGRCPSPTGRRARPERLRAQRGGVEGWREAPDEGLPTRPSPGPLAPLGGHPLPMGEGQLKALILEAPHVFAELSGIASIAAMKEIYATTDLRDRLARYHRDVDNAFRGWNDVWLDPRFREWNIEEFLPSISVPILLIQGTADEYGTWKQIEAIERQVRGPVEILRVPEAGHAPHRDEPEMLLEKISAYISRVRP